MSAELHTWNHRVFEMDDGHGGTYFEVHEVWYNEDKVPKAYTEDATTPMGDTLEELSEDLAWYVAALSNPVLREGDFDFVTEAEVEEA